MNERKRTGLWFRGILVLTMLLGGGLVGGPARYLSAAGADQRPPSVVYWYYVGGEQVSLPLAMDQVAVRFAPGLKARQKADILRGVGNLAPLAEGKELAVPDLALLKTRAGLGKANLPGLLNRLRSHKDVAFAHPVFAFSDGRMTLTDQFVARFNPDVSRAAMTAFNASHGVEVLKRLGLPNTYVLRVGAGADALAMANRYHESDLTAYATPDFVRFLQGQYGPNDTHYPNQWGLENTGSNPPQGGTDDADIDASSAWDIEMGDPNVTIAIIDEGVELDHEDLDGKIVAHYSAIPGDGDGGDPNNTWDAHGTNCAGIAAAETGNQQGVAGVCPNCSLMAGQIAYSEHSGDPWVTQDSWIADAMIWAVENGADVLSNSWGGGSPSDLIDSAITHAVTNGRDGLGSVVLFAAGNGGTSPVIYPASNDDTIAVGATSPCDERANSDSCDGESWWGSNYGAALDVVAPGVQWWSTDMMGTAGYSAGHYFDGMNGTSSATPAAAGLAGLILSHKPCLSGTQVREIIEHSAEDQVGLPAEDSLGWDRYMGWGRINAHQALLLADAYPCGELPCGIRVYFDLYHDAGDVAGQYTALADLVIEELGGTFDAHDQFIDDAAALAGYSTLLIPAPEYAFDPAEIAAIASFVAGGGHLVVLGEWSGAPDTDALLNDLLSGIEVKISLNADTVYDDTDHEADAVNWPLIHRFTPHRLTSGLQQLALYASASLNVEAPAFALASGDADTYTGVISAEVEGLPGTGGTRLATITPADVSATTPIVVAYSASGAGDVLVIGDADLWADADPDADGTISLNEYDNHQLAFNVLNRGGCEALPPCDGVRILFDETHGSYPDYTIAGQYSEMAALLVSSGHVVDALQDPEPFEYAAIRQYDVLVLMLPGEYYTRDEKEAIARFVNSGGRLVTIGDNGLHFGLALDILNDVHAALGDGLIHNDDHVIAPRHHASHPHRPLIHVFSSDIVNHGVDWVSEYTASSLQVSGMAYGTAFGDEDTFSVSSRTTVLDGGALDLTIASHIAAPPGPLSDTTPLVTPDYQAAATTQGLGLPPAPAAAILSGGEVKTWWPSHLTAAWGVAFDGNAGTLWVGNPVDAWGGDGDDVEYRPGGTAALRVWSVDGGAWYGPADLAYDWNTGMAWYVDVGGDNCLHELDPASGLTGDTICSPAWSTSQRGVAYDPTTDTWYVGGWNEGIIYHIDSNGTLIDWADVGLSIAGLAYNPDTAHLFAMLNADPNPIYVLDAASGYAILGQFTVSQGFGAFSGAGLEFDCSGNLWAVDQNTEAVYQFASGEAASFCKPHPTPVIMQAMSRVGTGDVFAIGDVNLWDNAFHGELDHNQLALNVFAGSCIATCPVALFNDSDTPSNEEVEEVKEVLDYWHIPYDVFDSDDIGQVDLGPYCKAIVASQQPRAFYEKLSVHAEWFEDWIAGGGVLEFHGASDADWSGLTMPGGFTYSLDPQNDVTILDHSHPIASYPNAITDAELDGWNDSSHSSRGYLTDLPPEAINIVAHGDSGQPATAEFGLGEGCVVATQQPLEWAWENGYSRILENFVLHRCGPPLKPILLVDDDDDGPDVRPFYKAALEVLGYEYDVYQVPDQGDGYGPPVELMADYRIVIWFSGYDFGGPSAYDEEQLAGYLDGGGHLWLVSQDYLFARPPKPPPTFGTDYLHIDIDTYEQDVGHTVVTGTNAFSGLGPYALSYPDPLDNWSDRVDPDAASELAFSGTNEDGGAAIEHANRTIFFAYPWEAIADLADRVDVMDRAIDYLGGYGLPPEDPVINVRPAALEMTLYPDQPATVHLEIGNAGGGVLTYTVSEDPSVAWLGEDPLAGDVWGGGFDIVHVTFDPGGVAPGVYATDLVIDHNDGAPDPYTVPVTLTVQARPLLTVSPELCQATLAPEQTVSQTLGIGNAGGGVLTYTLGEAPDVAWLWENPTGGDVPAGQTDDVTIHFDAAGLAIGEYSTGLIIDHNDGPPVPYTLPCTLNVACGASLYVTPDETAVYLSAPVFTVAVWISDVVHLGGFHFDLTYDPSVVAVQDVELGEFPGSTGRSWFVLGPDIDDANGVASYGAVSSGDPAGPDGTGVLAIVTLEAQAAGDSDLKFGAVTVTDTTPSEISPLCLGDGRVTVITCDPVTDVDFEWADPLRTSRPATFTGTVGGGTPPFMYAWAFGDGSAAAGEVVAHTYDHAAADTHPLRVSLDVVNACTAGHAEHPLEVWFFFDFDLDCDVDIEDLMAVATRRNCKSKTGDVCYDAYYDVELDGDIDIFDIMQTAVYWGWNCP